MLESEHRILSASHQLGAEDGVATPRVPKIVDSFAVSLSCQPLGGVIMMNSSGAGVIT